MTVFFPVFLSDLACVCVLLTEHFII